MLQCFMFRKVVIEFYVSIMIAAVAVESCYYDEGWWRGSDCVLSLTLNSVIEVYVLVTIAVVAPMSC